MSEATLPKPTLYDQLFPGRFIKAGDLAGKDRTLTISDVIVEAMPTDDGGTKVRGIVAFKETERQLALNRTNGEACKAMFGKAIKDWFGKRVTIYPTTDRFGSEQVDAIRVRGSPDIAGNVTFSLKLPKRKAREITLTKTVRGPAEDASKGGVA
jgi:hypothetical protein